MKLEKAIENLTEIPYIVVASEEKDFGEAIQLGIEAMKFRLELEQEDPEIALEPLPGETED